MRIMIDLDGTICELKKPGQDYAEVRVNPGAVQKLRALKAAGHYIILQTARHMKSTGGDQGQLVARVGKKTLDWLHKHKIPYDEIYFGKPYAHAYLDDLAHKFTGWDNLAVDDFDEHRVNIVIPMAGTGSRFVNAGYTQPKPLIKVFGKPMVSWAMKSFDFIKKIKSYRLIFIISETHNRTHTLGATLKKMFGEKTIVLRQSHNPRGQADTCLVAKDYINNHNRLFIYNCDTYGIAPIWEMIEKENPDGILTCFKSKDPRYSFAKLDKHGHVCETAEKKVISSLASTGMYYFKRGSDFVSAAEQMIKKNKKYHGEFYVAPCYNELLKSGKIIRTVLAKKNHIMGTPEELHSFVKNYKKP